MIGDCYGPEDVPTEISDCTANITINATGDSIGGLIGYLDNSFMENCHSTVLSTAQGDDDFPNLSYGGLVGNYNSIISGCSFTDCYSKGTIIADKVNTNGVGGLIGTVDTDQVVTVSGCYYEGEMRFTNSIAGDIGGLIGTWCGDDSVSSEMDSCYSKCGIDFNGTAANDEIGGLIGFCEGLNINKTYFDGNISVTCEQDVYNVGGLIGYYDTSNVITNCYSQGEIVCISTVEASGQAVGSIGGLIGGTYSEPSDVLFENCYSSCNITCTSATGAYTSMVGGFIGDILPYHANSYTIRNCFSAGSIAITGDSEDVGGLIGADESDFVNSAATVYENCSWYSAVVDNAIGRFGYVGGTPEGYVIPLLATAGFGTDEPDHTLLQHKEHTVYAQGT